MSQLLGGSSPTPWYRALQKEHGYAAPESPDARQLLVAAKTAQLWAWGGNVGLTSRLQSRFTSPQEVLLVGVGEGMEASVSVAAPQAGRPSQPLGVKEAYAAGDFAVLLTWDGCSVDTRVLLSVGLAPGQQQRQRPLLLPALWHPPGTAVIQLAAGGCWQGPGRESGGHVLALAADGSVWGWGANFCGQLGLGIDADWVPAPAEVLGPSAAQALGEGVAQVSCGDAHSSLLLRSGTVVLAGSNCKGACGVGQGMEAVPVFCRAALPGGAVARRLSCGGHNTAVVTTGGRLLVCGDNEFGQCGGAPRAGPGGCCWELRDVGPGARWHGMPRVNQDAGGGGGQAAAQVTDVCCGHGSLYAVTDAGDVYAWGQGGQGELGLGGSCKNNASPSKLPWARDVALLAASAGGRFAAAVDAHGKLLTFGAGKFGNLGHGDTNKRAVGRPVKALQHAAVRSVCCGSSFMLAVTAWRPPPPCGRGTRRPGGAAEGQGSAGKKGPAPPARREPSTPRSGAGSGEAGDGAVEEPALPASPSFRYAEVDPGWPPSPGHSRGRRRRAGALVSLLRDDPALSAPSPPDSPSWSITTETPRSTESSLFPDTPSTAGSLASASTPTFPGDVPLPDSTGGGSSWPRDISRRGGGGSNVASRRSGNSRGGHRQRWVPPDAEGAVQRRRRWMAEPPPGEGHYSGGEEGGEAGGPTLGEGGSDRRFRYLLRRQLKAFAASPQQRELAFPASLSPSDRYKIHVTAEAWGLMHQSHGDGAERRIVVWKPSRARRSLKPGMLPGAAGAAHSAPSSSAGATPLEGGFSSAGAQVLGDRAEAAGGEPGGAAAAVEAGAALGGAQAAAAGAAGGTEGLLAVEQEEVGVEELREEDVLY